MTTYYLQCRADERWFIHDQVVHDAKRVSESVDARCWLGAKKIFGFPLSPAQEALLRLKQ